MFEMQKDDTTLKYKKTAQLNLKRYKMTFA